MLDDRVQVTSKGSGCCPKQPLVMVYVAVLSYFSVAFMGLSTLPAWLQSCVIAENPDATPDEVAVIYGARYSAFTFVQGTVIALVAGWAGALSDRFGRRRCAALPAIGQAAGSAVLRRVCTGSAKKRLEGIEQAYREWATRTSTRSR